MVCMPSHPDADPAPLLAHEHTPAAALASPAFPFAPAGAAPSTASQQALALANACRALWSATLSLMTAFMQIQAPAHRLLLARRISRNLHTLSRQDCFDAGCRATFRRLAGRWQARCEQLSPEGERKAATGLLRVLSEGRFL